MKNGSLKEKIEIINRQLEFLKENYNIKIIGIFGSVIRREDSKYSDIDIIVEFSKPIGFLKFMELEYFLGRILKRKVDLVTKKALKPAIKQEVLKEAVYV